MTDSAPYEIRPIERKDLNWVAKFLDEHWGSTKIVSRGKLYFAHELPGFIAEQNSEKIGLITCRIEADECEIVTINSLNEGNGVGTALLATVRELAEMNECRRVWVVTTNDNLEALRFFQKRGFKLVAVHRNALEKSRKFKPEIPLVGRHGIPMYDEIELEAVL